MQFRTELIIPPSPFRISHQSKILTAGSCFAQVTGDKLFEYKFPVLNNPFGTIFNPLSLFRLFNTSLENQALPSETYLEKDGLWYNYHLHSSLKASSKDALSILIVSATEQVKDYLIQGSFLVITLGTAYIYEMASIGEPVANCHKMPQSLFRKRLLSPDEILKCWERLKSNIKSLNPKLKFIISVSPVRHIKDTLPLNAVSKSILRMAAHEMTQAEDCEYFPAYEVMTDDLRDYRFYKEDMLHPTSQAENYIWEKFSACYFSEDTQQINGEWKKLLAALQHKAFSPGSEKHKQFLLETLKKLQAMEKTIDVSKEIYDLEKRMNEQ